MIKKALLTLATSVLYGCHPAPAADTNQTNTVTEQTWKIRIVVTTNMIPYKQVTYYDVHTSSNVVQDVTWVYNGKKFTNSYPMSGTEIIHTAKGTNVVGADK